MTTTTCTLLLNTSGLSNLTIKVDLSTSFSGVTCNQPTICSLTGTVLTFNGSQYQWSATNPVVNGTYYIELSAYVNSSIKTIDNSEPPIVILPQTITTIVSSNSTVVGSVATLTLTLNASVHIANQTTLSISFPKWDPIGSLPYQDPYSCSNVSSNSSADLNCSYFNALSTLNFNNKLNGSTSLIIQLNNFKNPSSTQPYTIQGFLSYNSNGIYAVFTAIFKATTLPQSIVATLPNYLATASTNSTINVSLALSMYCTSNTSVEVDYDKSLIVTASNTTTFTFTTGTTSIIFSGITCISGKYITIPQLTITNPSVSRTVNLKFTTFYNTTGTAYYIQTGNYSTTLTANQLVYLYGSLSNLAVSATGVSLSLNFCTFSALANKDNSNLSYYLITLDSDYITTSISCFDLSLNATVYCSSFNGQSNIIKIQAGNKPANSNFSVRIDNLINPRYFNANVSTIFNVSTYSYNVDDYYKADESIVSINLIAKTLIPVITTNTTVAGQPSNITIILNSSLLSGDTVKFSLNASTAMPTAINVTGNNSFTFTQGQWQFTASINNNITNFSFYFVTINPAFLTSNEPFPTVLIVNNSTGKMNSQTNSSLMYPATDKTSTFSAMSNSTSNSYTGAYTNTTLNIVFSMLYSSGDVLQVSLPNSYSMTNFHAFGVSGLASTLSSTVSGNQANITLIFTNVFNLSTTYSINLQYFNSYITDPFVIGYNTFTNNTYDSQWAAKESYSGTLILSANSVTFTHSAIQLLSNQTITFTASYPFTVVDGSSVTLDITTGSQNYNISACSSLTTGTCSVVSAGIYRITGVNTSQNTVFTLNSSFGYFTSAPLTITTHVNSKLSTSTVYELQPFCSSNCWTCDSSDPTKCITCFPNGTAANAPLYYAATMKCYDQCPAGSFLANVSSQQCLNCDVSCATCSSISSCLTCQQDYIKASNNGLCVLNCSSECSTCSVSKNNCTSCPSGTVLYNYQCLSECPSGTYLKESTNSCTESKLAYFPFVIVAGVVLLLALGSKYIEPTTDVITICVAILGIMEMACLVALLSNSGTSFKQSLYVGLACIVLQLIINGIGLALYILFLRKDEQFIDWLGNSIKNKISLYIILSLSTITSFKFFRMIYSRFLGRDYFSARFSTKYTVIPVTNVLSGIHLLLFLGLSLTVAGLLLFNKDVRISINPQIFLFSIELVVLDILSIITVLLDVKKPEDYFEGRGAKMYEVSNDQEIMPQHPTITLQNIMSLPNIEQVSEDALIKSPKHGIGAGQRKNGLIKAEKKPSLTIKKENLTSPTSPISPARNTGPITVQKPKIVQKPISVEKPKSVEKPRQNRSPPIKVFSSRVSPVKDLQKHRVTTNRSDRKEALPVASVPVLVKENKVSDVILELPISKHKNKGKVQESKMQDIVLELNTSKDANGAGVPIRNENQDDTNEQNPPSVGLIEFDKSTVANKRMKTSQKPQSYQRNSKQMNHTVRIGQDFGRRVIDKKSEDNNNDAIDFRRTTEIKMDNKMEKSDKPQIPLPRKGNKNDTKINDLFLGFLNNEEHEPKSKPRMPRRLSRDIKQAVVQPNSPSEAFSISRGRDTDSDDISATSNFRTRFGGMYDFNQDYLTEADRSELNHTKKIEETTVLNDQSKQREKSPPNKQKMKLKKTKDIYIPKNLPYARDRNRTERSD